MNENIAGLLDFVNNRPPQADAVRAAAARLGDRNLHGAAIHILGWLATQHRIGKPVPFPLDVSHEWCRDISQLVQEGGLLSDSLTLRDGNVEFRPDLDEDERRTISEFVNQRYVPKLRT